MHTLMQLTYKYDALEPHIDAQTMELHHTKHHQAYVDKLNAALKDHPDLQTKSVGELISNLDLVPANIRAAVQNNGGGHANHNLFFTLITPGGSDRPHDALSAAIGTSFGGFQKFKKLFNEAAMGHFGSGWIWLNIDGDGNLTVETTRNQDSPLMLGHSPILGLDVWEHAYYLKYQNRRADYISAWWNVVNWDKVDNNYEAVLSRDTLVHGL